MKPISLILASSSSFSLAPHSHRGQERTGIEHPHANPLYEGRPLRYLYMSLCRCVPSPLSPVAPLSLSLSLYVNI